MEQTADEFLNGGTASASPTTATGELSADDFLNGTDPPVQAKQSVAGAVQAGGSGINAGVADIMGLPWDTVQNVIDLGKAAIGSGYQAITGKVAPEALQIEPRENIPGTSDWVKKHMRSLKIGGFDLTPVDAVEDTTANRIIHAGSEGATNVLMGTEGGTPGALRAATAGAASSAVPTAASEAGLPVDPVSGAALSYIAGHAANSVAERSKAALSAIKPPEANVPSARGEAPSDDALKKGFEETREARLAAAAKDTNTPETALPSKASLVPPETRAIKLNSPRPENQEFGDAPPKEQADREALFRRLGARHVLESAITGNSSESSKDYDTASKKGTPQSEVISNVLAHQRDILRSATDDVKTMSGGVGAEAGDGIRSRDDNVNVGKALSAPVHMATDLLKAHISDLYAKEDAKYADTPFQATNTSQFLDKMFPEFMLKPNGASVLNGLKLKMQQLGLRNSDNSIGQGSGKEYDALYRSIGSIDDPQMRDLLGGKDGKGGLKDALQKDAEASFGPDAYKDARKASQFLHETLLKPDGIAGMARAKDQLGINPPVSLEDIPNHVENMDSQQFQHYVGMLKEWAGTKEQPQLQDQAVKALKEVRALYADGMKRSSDTTKDTAKFNHKNLNNYIKLHDSQIQAVYAPKEIQHIKDVNDAAQALQINRAGRGGGGIGHTQVTNALIGGAGALATAAGVGASTVLGGGVPGALGSGVVGSALGKGVKSADQGLLRRQANARVRDLTQAPKPTSVKGPSNQRGSFSLRDQGGAAKPDVPLGHPDSGVSLYHGSRGGRNIFSKFPDAQGMYFTENPDVARRFAGPEGSVKQYTVDMKKPLITDKSGRVYYLSPRRRALLESQGYDGVITKMGKEYGGNEYLVFDKDKAKELKK